MPKMMRIILLGAPGAGKGTQAEKLSHYFHIPKISTGDMLRSEVAKDSAIGRDVRDIMRKGHFVPDEIIMLLIRERLIMPDCQQGYLFDGFPRTLSQAECMVKEGIVVDYVVNIEVPDTEIIERLSGRRIHPASGRSYHVRFNPPKVDNVDDITGEPLIQRADDEVETIRQRLHIYHQQTKPLVDWYQHSSIAFISVKGTGSVDNIFNTILSALDVKKMAKS